MATQPGAPVPNVPINPSFVSAPPPGATPSEARRVGSSAYQTGRLNPTIGGVRIPDLPRSTMYLQQQAAVVSSYRQETAAGLSGQPGGIYVYTGKSAGHVGSYKTMDSLMSEFEGKSFQEKKRMAKLLAMAGFLDVSGADTVAEIVEEASLMELTEAYADLLGTAAARFTVGQEVTPNDVLEMNIRYNMGRAGFDMDDKDFDVDKWYDKVTKKEDLSRVEVEKQRSVDIWSPEDARGLARSTLQSALGRDPTEAEYEDFVAALQAKQRANPIVTTTRTKYNVDGQPVNQRSTETGGLNEYGIQQFAQEEAESAPDWAEWQAVGTYFPALMQMLGSVVPNG